MSEEPSSIRTMQRFYADRLFILAESETMAELVGGNDRSTIITIAAHVDAAVESKVAENLPGLKGCDEKQFNYAFRHDGPLGSFSAKIDMAFYLGLIDERLRNQIHDLRNMRNAVAHTKRRVSFADKELQNVTKRLLSPVGSFKLSGNGAEHYRGSFLAEGNLIGAYVTFGRDEAIKMVRDAFAKAGQPMPF